MARKGGMSRRDLFRWGWLGATGAALAGFGGASLAMLWPSLRGGFGAKINLGSVANLKEQLAAEPTGILYFPEARTYLVDYKPVGDTAQKVYKGLALFDEGFLGVYQKCAHLGCKVPTCDTSKWFECPCHGSRYNKAGEYKFGPAPRGLSHFPLTVDGDNVIVDTSQAVPGPPRGIDTTQQNAEGPHCVG